MNIDCYKCELENVEPYVIPYRKIKRSKRLLYTKCKKAKLIYIITNNVGYKPSIYVPCSFDKKSMESTYKNYIRYGKHSNQQKWMKKYSNKVFRKLKMRELKSKGKIYRRYFDYWWTWL